jgi:hypothetical protein
VDVEEHFDGAANRNHRFIVAPDAKEVVGNRHLRRKGVRLECGRTEGRRQRHRFVGAFTYWLESVWKVTFLTLFTNKVGKCKFLPAHFL